MPSSRLSQTSTVAGNVKVKVTVDTKLEQRLARVQKLTAEINELLDLKNNLTAKIMTDAPGGYETEDWRVTIVPGISEARISKELLVALGVKASVIQKATKPGTPYRYPKITDKKAAAEKKAATRAKGDD